MLIVIQSSVTESLSFTKILHRGQNIYTCFTFFIFHLFLNFSFLKYALVLFENFYIELVGCDKSN